MTMKPVLKILTDYPRDDLAHDEVHQALVTACIKHQVDAANIDVGAVPGLDTVVAGFKTAQLAMNSVLGFGHIFHTNCAPRKNIVSVKSQGEKIVLGMSSSGVAVLITNAGYTLAPFYDLAQSGDMTFFQTSVEDAGSQFRSRDYFPDAMAELAAHFVRKSKELGEKKINQLLERKSFSEILEGLSYIGAPLKLSSMPQLPLGAVFYVDNFGNMKLNFKHQHLLKMYEVGTMLVLCLGGSVCDAVVGDVGFSQGEGVVAVTSGSSGWEVSGQKEYFSEVMLRGGRAESHFKGFRTGDQLWGVRKADLEKVIEMLKDADPEVSERLDLYNISEAKIIETIAKVKLIKDGFDTSPLKQALASGTLLKQMAGG